MPTKARSATRRFAAYVIHGHEREAPVDYASLLERLITLPYERRVSPTKTGTVVIATVRRLSADTYVMRVATGRPGEPPTLINVITGLERVGDLEDSEMVAHSALVLINVESRAVLMERRRPSVPVSDLETALSEVGRRSGFRGLTIALTPLLNENFAAELDEFERVRRADVVLVRPNHNWSDSAAQLADLAAASNAAAIEVGASAPRGQSLSLDSGIVEDVRDFSKRKIGPIKNARIVGRKRGADRETSLSFDRHQVRTDIQLDLGAPAQEREAALIEGASAYIATLDTSEVP